MEKNMFSMLQLESFVDILLILFRHAFEIIFFPSPSSGVRLLLFAFPYKVANRMRANPTPELPTMGTPGHPGVPRSGEIDGYVNTRAFWCFLMILIIQGAPRMPPGLLKGPLKAFLDDIQEAFNKQPRRRR